MSIIDLYWIFFIAGTHLSSVFRESLEAIEKNIPHFLEFVSEFSKKRI
jgi:hypothetical protein